MKNLFRVIIFLVIGLSFIACGPSVAATPSPISSTMTPAATFTPIPSPTATATVEPAPTQGSVHPTLLPIIEPNLARDLLSKAFSLQSLEGPNGHRIRRVTGWDYGFRRNWCPGYEWLDASHLVLYPSRGQEDSMGSGPLEPVMNFWGW